MAHDKFSMTIEGVLAEVDQYTGKDSHDTPEIWKGIAEIRKFNTDIMGTLVGQVIEPQALNPLSSPCEIGPYIRMANAIGVIIEYSAQYKLPIFGFSGEPCVRRYLSATQKSIGDVDRFLNGCISQVSVRKKGFKELFDPSLNKGWLYKTTADGTARKVIMVSYQDERYLGLLLSKESKDGWREGWQVKITKY